MAIHATYAQELTGDIPILYVREGEARDELALIDEEEQISLLVLGADTNSETAGPLISFLMSKAPPDAGCRSPLFPAI